MNIQQENKIIGIVDDYNSNNLKYTILEREIDVINSKLNTLKVQREDLSKELNNIRDREKLFMDEMRTTVGFDEDAFKRDLDVVLKKIRKHNVSMDKVS